MTKKKQTPIKQPITYEVCNFRHSDEVRDLINEVAEAESLGFTDVMRQLVNAGLNAKYNVQIQGNRVIDRGDAPSLQPVSRAG